MMKKERVPLFYEFQAKEMRLKVLLLRLKAFMDPFTSEVKEYVNGKLKIFNPNEETLK